MKVNTHGLKMTGLRKACSESKILDGYYSGKYIQINYDKLTGEVFSDYHYSLGQNSWTEYHDPNVINCGNICNPMTMQGIADLIANRVAQAC